jgi:peroxiredoxin
MASKTKKSKDTTASTEENPGKLSQKQKNYIYTGVFFTIIIFLFIVNNFNGEPDEGPYPPYYLESLQHNLTLSDYRGKVVALSFWTTTDKKCEQSLADLVYLKDFYKKEDFEVIGVSLDAATKNGQSTEQVKEFINKLKINFPVLIGTNKTMSDYGGIPKLPALFLIDKYGYIVSHHQGLVNTMPLAVDIKLALESSGEESSLVAPDFTLQKITANN